MEGEGLCVCAYGWELAGVKGVGVGINSKSRAGVTVFNRTSLQLSTTV